MNAASKLDPDNVKIVITRARIYVALELFDSAIQEFKSALADTLATGDRQTLQGELDDLEQHAAKERLKVKDYYEILGTYLHETRLVASDGTLNTGLLARVL